MQLFSEWATNLTHFITYSDLTLSSLFISKSMWLDFCGGSEAGQPRSSSARLLSAHCSYERQAAISHHGLMGLHATAHHSSLLEHSLNIHLPYIRARMSKYSVHRVI